MKPLVAIPATIAIVYRAWSRQSLTPPALLVATITAIAHALHPWSIFFALLAVFFLAGTAVKHHQKSLLTLSTIGGATLPPTPSPRTTPQVLANSLCASILITIHWIYLRAFSQEQKSCFPIPSSGRDVRQPFPSVLLPLGILANYAAVTADTFSSELGILSSAKPLLLTDIPTAILTVRLPRRVPPGTNGGVTVVGLAAGALGAMLISIIGVALMPFCATWTKEGKFLLLVLVMVWGLLGSLLDSLLGGYLQATVVDSRTGKVIESSDGGRINFEAMNSIDANCKEGSKSAMDVVKVIGMDFLDNNGVNFIMAAGMSTCAMIVGYWIML